MGYKCRYCGKEYAKEHALAGHMNFCPGRSDISGNNAVVRRLRESQASVEASLKELDAAHKRSHGKDTSFLDCHDCWDALADYAKENRAGLENMGGCLVIGPETARFLLKLIIETELEQAKAETKSLEAKAQFEAALKALRGEGKRDGSD